MNFFSKTLFFLVFLTVFQVSDAQRNRRQIDSTLSLHSGTIDNQFEYVIQRSNRYQEFKVVKREWLYTLKSHVLDSIKVARENLVATQNEVNTQAEQISTLNNELQNTKNNLTQVEGEKDSMALFGIQMSKIAYNSLMWTIIGVLLFLLFFFVFKFKSSNSITKQAKQKLQELELEYEDHRRVALEREQKVRRQLQDEINKNKA